MSDGLGDVGGAVYPQDAEGEVAERGHGAGAGVGADLGAVFVVGDVAYPVQPISMAQWPRIRVARSVAVTCSVVRLVTAYTVSVLHFVLSNRRVLRVI